MSATRARMEIDHKAHAAYIDFGVERRGVGAAVQISPTVTVDLDPAGVAVGVELLSLQSDALPLRELRANGCFRDEDAQLIETNLPVILAFLSGSTARSAHPAASGVDCFYLAS